MKNFKTKDERGGSFRGGSNGGKPTLVKKSWGSDRGGNNGGGRDRDVVMHKAICSHCGKSCEVPFFPSGDKPVFCRDCFNRTRDSVNPQGQPSKFSNHGPRQSYGDRQSAPRRDFAKPEFKSSQGPVNDDIKKYFSEISTKLDRLINNIERLSVTKVQSDVVSEVSEKSKPTKIKETKVVKPTKSKVPTKKK